MVTHRGVEMGGWGALGVAASALVGGDGQGGMVRSRGVTQLSS